MKRYDRLRDALEHVPDDLIQVVVGMLEDCVRINGRVFTVGNGGSAAMASHFAADLGKKLWTAANMYVDSVCVTDSCPENTAWVNDDDPHMAYLNALERRGIDSRDVLVAISSSGNSPNVVNATRFATSRGAGVVSLTGSMVQTPKVYSDVLLQVNLKDYETIEDAHSFLLHELVLRTAGRFGQPD